MRIQRIKHRLKELEDESMILNNKLKVLSIKLNHRYTMLKGIALKQDLSGENPRRDKAETTLNDSIDYFNKRAAKFNSLAFVNSKLIVAYETLLEIERELRRMVATIISNGRSVGKLSKPKQLDLSKKIAKHYSATLARQSKYQHRINKILLKYEALKNERL